MIILDMIIQIMMTSENIAAFNAFEQRVYHFERIFNIDYLYKALN